MLDIEKDLENDVSGEYKRNIIATLMETSTKVRNELGKGLVPDEYKKLSTLLMALEASIKIVEQY